jgi:hypothetical protein
MTYHKSDFTRIIILSILTFTLSLVGRSVTAQQVPHTFQNGQVIDAEQMNQNFDFVQTGIRGRAATTVDCGAGETIADAINAGYNTLAITGNCVAKPFIVSRINPVPFGMTDADMPNNPIPHLVIYGASEGAKLNLSDDTFTHINVSDNAYLQIHSIEINASIFVFKNSVLEITNSTINGWVEILGNSMLNIKNSTINGTENQPLRIKNGSSADVEDTAFNPSSNSYEGIWLWNNASLQINGNSTVTAPDGIRGINLTMNSSAVLMDDVVITSTNQPGISIDSNSSVELNDNVQVSSSGTDEIWVGPTGYLRVNGAGIMVDNISCGGITAHVQVDDSNDVTLEASCNGFNNLQ